MWREGSTCKRMAQPRMPRADNMVKIQPKTYSTLDKDLTTPQTRNAVKHKSIPLTKWQEGKPMKRALYHCAQAQGTHRKGRLNHEVFHMILKAEIWKDIVHYSMDWLTYARATG